MKIENLYLNQPQQYIFIWGNNRVEEMVIVIDLN